VLSLKEKCDSSQEIELTDKYISFLKSRVSQFQDADPKHQEKIVRKATNHIKRTWGEDTVFDRTIVKGVCDLSATLGHSHILLAY